MHDKDLTGCKTELNEITDHTVGSGSLTLQGTEPEDPVQNWNKSELLKIKGMAYLNVSEAAEER